MRRLKSHLSNQSKWKASYLDVIAVGTIHFLLSLLILCYGVYLMQFVMKDGFNLKMTLWTPILYNGTYKITAPWIKSFCLHVGHIRTGTYKWSIVVFTLLIFVDLIVIAFYTTPISITIGYGLLGGLFSSFILVYVKLATNEKFQENPRIFNILDQFTKPFCLLTMPNFILFLTNFYGTSKSLLIVAALILNVIPCVFLIKTRKIKNMDLCKYTTMDRLSDIELNYLNNEPVVEEVSSSSEEEQEEVEEQAQENNDSSEVYLPFQALHHSNIQSYYETAGVKILPDIPEENEEEEDINEINSKRLSKISAILQGLNENTPRGVTFPSTNLFKPEEAAKTRNSEEEMFTVKVRRKCSMSKAFKLGILSSFLKKHFKRTLPCALMTPYFYPALISNSLTATLSTVVLGCAPTIFLNADPKLQQIPNPMEESTFLLTIFGFSWLFFLAGYPIFKNMSSCKNRLLFLFGITTLGCSLYVVHNFANDRFVLFSLMFGLGHGVTTYAENMAHANFCGEKTWKVLQGTLEITTGFIVIFIYLTIYLTNLGIFEILLYAYWICVFDVGFWMLVYGISEIYLLCKRRKRKYNLQEFHI